MTKKDLIQDLQSSQENSFTILSKGYLLEMDMDEEIFSHLLPLLEKESAALLEIADTLATHPENISDEDFRKFQTDSENFYDLVQETCLDEIQEIPYIAESLRILRDKANSHFISKVKAKIEQGHVFKENPSDGSLSITDPEGDVIFSSPFIPMRKILEDQGIDVNNPHFALFYFSFIPKNELYQYRLAHAFRTCFGF